MENIPLQDQQPTWRPSDHRKIARVMELSPNVAIFKRFGSLAMLHLLELQAKLEFLDGKLGAIPSPEDSEQDEILSKSRDLLSIYYSLLLRATKVTRLSSPSSKEWDAWTKLCNGPQRPDEDENTLYEDYVMLESPELRGGSESFVNWLTPILAKWYWKRTGYQIVVKDRRIAMETGEEVVFSGDTSQRFKDALGFLLGLGATIIASLVPALTILWLYHVQTTGTRIGITIGMTALLGVILRLTTNANLKEIFGATAAFAAVEVVFIGSANGR